ncbi:MAG: hypothetical protein NTZ02_00360 [Candidatus Woesearchaeota archaeon]|nr:hypothetical protein [Candidatus Woesearchaeota archaeon]
MRFFRSKKGAIEVSINTIIILIFAIAILGIGLSFIRSSIAKATAQFDVVSDQVKNDMINSMKQSTDIVSVQPIEYTLTKTTKNPTMYFAVRNLGADDATYNVIAEPCISIDDPDPSNPHLYSLLKVFPTIIVKNNSIEVKVIQIKNFATLPETTYECGITINNPDDTLYGTKQFTIQLTA